VGSWVWNKGNMEKNGGGEGVRVKTEREFRWKLKREEKKNWEKEEKKMFSSIS
jgi:hypothetical protein